MLVKFLVLLSGLFTQFLDMAGARHPSKPAHPWWVISLALLILRRLLLILIIAIQLILVFFVLILIVFLNSFFLSRV
jgi:hypothetical protein